MSDSVAMALISALVTVITTVCGMIVVWLKVQESVKAAEAARELGESNEKSLEKVKVDAVASDAKTAGALADITTTVDRSGKTSEAIHTLVNSAMSTQLKLNAVMARRLASLTNEPGDVEAAALAEKLFHEHDAKQKVVDEQQGRPVPGKPEGVK